MNRKYLINDHAFDHLTDDASYWVGFLLADGCCMEKYRIIVRLSHKDEYHLEKFREFIGAAIPIKKTMQTNGYGTGCIISSICINNKTIFKRLKQLGVIPRKSLIAKPIPCLARNSHFWRGMIDGDGCVSQHTIKRKPPRSPRKIEILYLCGSQDCCDSFRLFCTNFINTKAKIKPYQSIWRFTLASKNARRIMDILYPIGCTSLNRKYAIVNQCLGRI